MFTTLLGPVMSMFGSLFGSARTWLPIAIAAGVGGWLYFGVIGGYKSQIVMLEQNLTQHSRDLSEAKSKLALQQAAIVVSETSVSTLKNSLNNVRVALEANKVREDQLAKEIEKWKKQPPKEVVRYIERVVSPQDRKEITVEGCKKVNENISHIRYKDL
jgi:hypothetical protein